MNDIAGKKFVGNNDLSGIIVSEQQLNTDEPGVLLQLDNNQRVVVPRSLLVAKDDGSYFIALNAQDIDAAKQIGSDEETIVVPVIAEELAVAKRKIETGKVRIHKVVREHEETIDEPLLREEVTVERVPVNQIVEQPTQSRYEDDVLIVPVFEEVLVVEKRLMLKEELHISKRQTTRQEPQQVTVRHEEVNVERLSVDEDEAERGG